MSFKLSNNSKEHLKGVHPKLIELINEAIRTSPYDFGIPKTGGLRTAEMQNELYQQGRSNDKKIITYTDGYVKKSNHQAKEDGYGWAFDIFAFVNGKASWDKIILTEIAQHIKKVSKELLLDIEWGGDWKGFKDLPHFQLRTNKMLSIDTVK